MPPKRGRAKPAAGVARAAPAARPARVRRVKEEPPSEESSMEESSEEDSDDDPLDFFSLMPSKDDKGEDISIDRNWGKRHWGKTSTSWSMARQNSASDGTLATWHLSNLRKGFCKGNVRDIIAQCRNADNVPYSPEEIEDMVNDLNNNKHTLNLPFCFTKGTMELKNSILNDVFQGIGANLVDMGAAIDIEVGVYISRKGSAEAAWHYDNNHNFTFQLYGSKDWHTVDEGNNKNVISSRGLLDAPRNRTEQISKTPDFSKERTTRLEAGSVIYIPPGHWHRVVPVDADPVCLSVDIRIASVTTARWMCENIFAEFMSDVTFGYCGNGGYPTNRFVGAGGQDETLEQDVVNYPWRHDGDWDTCQDRHVEKLKAVLDGECRRRFWKPPVAMPFEPHLSDGMEMCASLQFLIDALPGDKIDGTVAVLKTELRPKSRLAFNPFVAVTKKRISDDSVVMHMRHTSGLTSMDYQHYGILCPSGCGCEVMIDMIIDQTVTAEDIKTLLDYDFQENAETDLVALLFYVNFLKLENSETDEPDEPTPRGKSKATGKTSRKRQKYIVPNP